MEYGDGGIRFSPRANRAREVAWRPWGPEAFDRAQESGRPVLLSISAVWCHWCHVMDETTYSDPAVIRLINDNYVAVRIDRDLRPDIDARYNMGGWPTAAFLTPEGDLLSGCTYAPPDQFASLLQNLLEAYRRDKEGIGMRAALARSDVQADAMAPPGTLRQGPDLLVVQQAVEAVRDAFDTEHGGFGSEPKFPHVDSLRLLLNWGRANEDAACLAMVRQSLDALMEGGLRDRDEGGFYRYATAADWSDPHYEKILLDNLKIAELYVEGYMATGDARYGEVALEVLDYAGGNLFDPSQGLFFGSQDADEGYYRLPLDQRLARPKPAVDATFYTDVNGQACSAYLKASWALGRPSLQRTALDALDKLLALEGSHTLRHSYAPGIGEGTAGAAAMLFDYAYLLRALLDAYDHTESDRYLNEAKRVASDMLEQLADEESGALFDTPKDMQAMAALRRRLVPVDGGALASEGLDRLGRATYDQEMHRRAGSALAAVVVDPGEHGEAASAYAMAVYRWLHPAIEVTVGGAPGSEAAAGMVLAAAGLPYPNLAIKPSQYADGQGETAWAEACLDTMCLAPVVDPAELRRVVLEHLRQQGREDFEGLPIVTVVLPPV